MNSYGKKYILMTGKLGSQLQIVLVLAKQAEVFFFSFSFLLLIQILVDRDNFCLLGYLTMESSTKEALEFAAASSGLSLVTFPWYTDRTLPCCDGCLARQ